MYAFLGFKYTKHINEYPYPSGKKENFPKEEKYWTFFECKVPNNIMPTSHYIIVHKKLAS